MGILNVTPDSFSDGGRFATTDRAVEHGLELLARGADLLDVGGESTRPKATPVSEAEELARVLPVITALVARGALVSIDTQKPEVARQALGLGAVIVNDVGGLRLPTMRQVCAEAGATVCIMHMQGTPATMQEAPFYENVTLEVRQYLLDQALLCEAEGIAHDKIWIDPGFGFGKTRAHNLQLLDELDQITSLPYPVLVGLSRKTFLAPEKAPTERAEETRAAQERAVSKGARILRVH